VITDLPSDKQRMLERLNSSDETGGRTVPLVDDDSQHFALSSVLERRGMSVLTATTGREAIALVESTPNLAIVLMDIMMPEMDGYQTIAKSGEPGLSPPADHRADCKGHERRPREVPRGRRLDYLAKPVNTEQLLSALRMWLHR
jgi:CheY-like chemotaxis protein